MILWKALFECVLGCVCEHGACPRRRADCAPRSACKRGRRLSMHVTATRQRQHPARGRERRGPHLVARVGRRHKGGVMQPHARACLRGVGGKSGGCKGLGLHRGQQSAGASSGNVGAAPDARAQPHSPAQSATPLWRGPPSWRAWFWRYCGGWARAGLTGRAVRALFNDTERVRVWSIQAWVLESRGVGIHSYTAAAAAAGPGKGGGRQRRRRVRAGDIVMSRRRACRRPAGV